MNFGENLKMCRGRANITQEELAKKLGISTKTIGRWESSSECPKTVDLKKLSSILKCETNDLLGIKEKKVVNKPKEEKIVVPKKEVKLSLNEQESKITKILSKAIDVIAKIIQVLLGIGVIAIVILMLFIPMIFKHVDINENTIQINLDKDTVLINREQNEYVISYNDEVMFTSQIDETIPTEDFLYLFNNHSKTSIMWHLEILLTIAIADMVVTYLIFALLSKVASNINNGDTPFTLDNVSHLQKMAYLLIATILLANLAEIVLVSMVNVDFEMHLSLSTLVIIFVLFVISYVFKYGHNLQETVESKIYY